MRDAEQSQVHAKFISGESAGSKTRLNAKIFAKCHCQCPAPPQPAQFPHSPISELPTPPAVPFVIIICLLRPDRPDEAEAARGANYIWAEFTCTHSALQKSAYIRTLRTALALRTASSLFLSPSLSLHCAFFAARRVLFFGSCKYFGNLSLKPIAIPTSLREGQTNGRRQTRRRGKRFDSGLLGEPLSPLHINLA